MIEIYDSTLRDGGYINNWAFTPEKLRMVYNSANDAGIKYVEIGYLDKVDSSEIIKKDAKIMVMIDYNKRDSYIIPESKNTNIDGIRVTSHKSDIENAINYTKTLNDKGYLTAIQVMGINNYSCKELGDLANKFNGIDIVSLADSNGCLLQEEVSNIIPIFKKRNLEDVPSPYLLNFHAHNNLQLALANSIEAMDNGANIIDCSFNGIGRGAGNLPTELILSVLNKYYDYEFNLNPVLECIDKYISRLSGGYKWGYNIPNMLSGIHRIHPYYGRDASKYEATKTKEILENIGYDNPTRYKGKRTILCVIPARYKSTRFLGKSLELIHHKPLIKWVYENASKVKSFDKVLIATDSDIIAKECENLKMDYVMTSEECDTGTDRIAEVSQKIDADLYINLQGDEPLITEDTIGTFVNIILNYGELDRVAYNAITYCDEEDLNNVNVPKVAIDMYGDMIYSSRLQIPYIKSDYHPKYYKELGLHAYTKKGLEIFNFFKPSNLERAENIEFLRFLEVGESIRAIYLDLPFKNHAVDVPDDIEIVERMMNEKNK